MAQCTALGFAGAVGEGPCPTQPSVDLAVKLMEAAIDDAQAKASKQCPEGCICKGKGMPVGPPTCYPFKIEGKQYYRWVMTATFDGECECPEKKRTKPRIEAKDYREFFRKVAELPKLPRKPKGECQMYQQQHGHGFPYPVCAGECTKGKCTTTVTAKPGSVVAECECR